jgi:hypothetical protein
MTAAVKTAPKPAGPKPAPKPKAPTAKPAATPKQLDNVPETDAAPKPAKVDRTGNAAYAPLAERTGVTNIHATLRKAGWTRPAISALTGFNDSQVWRAQNDKVHTSEIDQWMTFFARVTAGEVKPPTSGRKPKVEDLQARIDRALATLGDEAKTAAQYRRLIERVEQTLRGEAPAQVEAAAIAKAAPSA